MPRITIAAALLLAVGIMFVPATQAAPMFFLLGDHPDGREYDGSSDTAYGLRYDQQGALYSVGGNLGGEGGPLVLEYDPVALTAEIRGFIDRYYPGDGSDSGPGQAFFVEYELSGVVAEGAGFTATGGNGTASAAGPCSLNCDPFSLIGKQDDNGLAFIFSNIGFRLGPNGTNLGEGWVGNGWLEGAGTNDWLVTGVPSDAPGEEVPEPGTVGLMLIGLGMLAGGRKFRNRKQD